ncbi:MAG: hypothetical protein ACTSO9_08305 [Candidatus Helarchaeota archaeon]
MEKFKLAEILMKAFYLNEQQAQLYGVLLIKGVLTLGELGLLLNKDQEECIKVIKDLSNLKLIKSIPGKVVRYQALPPFKGFFALINEFQNLFDKVNGEISIKSKQLIDDFKIEIQKQIDAIQVFFQNQKEEANILVEQKKHYKGEIFAYIAEIKDNLQNLNRDLNGIFSAYLNSFEEKINIIKIDIEKRFSETLNELKDIKGRNKEFLEENITNLISPQKDGMKKLMEILNSSITSSFQNIISGIDSIKKDLISIIVKNGDILIDFSVDFQNKMLNFLNEQDKNVDNSLGDLKEKILKSGSQNLESFINKSSEIETLIFKNIVNIHEDIEKFLFILKNKETELMDSFFQNVQDKISQQSNDFSEILNISKSIFMENNEILNKNLKELLSSYLEDYKKKADDLKSKFQTNVDEFKDILNDLIKKINDQMINSIMEHRNANEKNTSYLESNLLNGLRQNYDYIQSSISSLIENVSDEFQTTITGFKDNISNLREDLFQNLTTTQSTIQKNVDETQSEIYKVIDSQIKTIEKETNLIDVQLKEKTVDEFERLNSDITLAKSSASSFFSDNISDLEKDPLIIKDKFEKLTNNQIDILDREILLLNESIKTTNSNFIVQFKNIINQLQKRSVESSNKYYNGLKKHLITLEKDIITVLDDGTDTLKEKIRIFQENFTLNIEKVLKYLQNTQDFEKQIIKNLKRNIEMIKKSASIISDNVSNLMNKQIIDNNLVTESFKSSFTKSINQELNNSEEILTNLSNLINKELQDILKSTKNINDKLTIEITNTLDNRFLEIKTSDEALNTNSKDIIKNHLKDYGSLTKAQKLKLKDNIDEINSIFRGLSRKLNSKFANTIKKHLDSNETIAVNLETNLKDIIKQNFNMIQTGINNLINKISKEFQENITNFIKNIQDSSNEIFQDLNFSQKNIQKNVKDTQNEIIKVLETQITTIEKEGTVLESQLKEKIENEFQNLNTEIISIKEDVSSLFSDFIKDWDNNSSLIKEKISKFLINQTTTSERESLLLEESIKTTITIFTAQFENIIEQLQNRSIEALNKHHIEFKEHLKTLNQDFLKILNERKISSKNKILSFQDQFSDILNKRLKYLENVQEFQRKISQDLKRHIEMIKKTAVIVTDNVSNLMNKQLTDFNLASESFKSYYSKIINKEINTSEESLSRLLTYLNNTFQENLKQNKNYFDNIQLEIPKIFDDSKYEHIKINEKLGKDVTSLVNTYLLDWRNKIDSIRSNVEFVTKHFENAEKESRNFLANIKDTFNVQINKFDESCSDVNQKINNSTENTVNSIKGFFNSLKSGKEKATNSLLVKIKDSINTNKDSFMNSFELILDDLRRNLSSNQELLSTTFINNSRMLHKQLEIQQEKLTQSINELKSSLTTNYIQKSKEELETSTHTLINNISKRIAPLKDIINNTLTQNNENLEIFLLNLRKNFQNISEKIIKDYEFRIQSVRDSIQDGLFEQFDDQTELISRIIENTNSILTREGEKSRQLMENLSENFENNTDNQLQNILKLFSKVDSMLMAMLEQFKEQKIEPLSEIVEEIKKDLQYLNEENQTTLDILSSALNEIEKKTFVDIEKTWRIASNESISDHIIDMNSRTKRSISIIIPSLSQLNQEQFKILEPNIMVHIFTNISTKKDKKLLQDILSLGNVRIWNITEKIPIFCALKDDEEMLLAPYSKNEGENVGIVTEQLEYIKIFQKIIGPYFLNNSNEIKKVEKKSNAIISTI